MEKIGIKSIKPAGIRHVYDLTVVDNHNFFIGKTKILTHNCDGFTPQAQKALRAVMEDYADVSFILTANNISRVIDPIRSRTQTFEITPPSLVEVAKHVSKILTLENVTYDLPTLKTILDVYYPDIRKILGECQSRTINGHLTSDTRQIANNDVRFKVLEILTQSGSANNKLKSLRQLFADSRLRDYSSIYRMLFDKVIDYAPNNISGAIVAINKGQVQDEQVVDKEINMVATLIELLDIIK